MKSALRARLKDEELIKLRDYCVQRIQDLRGARDSLFEAKLKKFAAVAASDFGYRLSAMMGGQVEDARATIFDKSNFSLQLVRSVCRFVLARTDKDLFGSSPWFAAVPQGPMDGVTAEEIQKHAEWKLREADWEGTGREVLQIALDLGWAVLKTTWRTEYDQSEELKDVLCDRGGKPLVSADGDYFYPDDETQDVEQPPEEMGEPAGMMDDVGSGDVMGGVSPSEEMPETPMPSETEQAPAPPEAMATPPLRVFAKDPSVQAPHPSNGHKFKEHLCGDEAPTRLYNGLDVQPVHWQDAGYPVNAAEMDLSCPECDFIFHTRTATLEQLQAQFDPDRKNPETQAVFEKMASGDTKAKNEGSMPKAEQGEPEVNRTDELNPSFKVTECYFRRRVLPTGPESRIFLCLIEDMEEVLWVEYLARMTPLAKAPLRMVAVNKVPGRAYGRGYYEVFEMAMDAMDRMINGILRRNDAHAEPIKAIDANALDTDSSGEVVVSPDRFLKLKTRGLPLNQIIQYLELPDLDTRTWQLMELFMQLVQTESGVTNATQGDLTNLPSNNTATGVNSLLESSSVLHLYILGEVKAGLTPALEDAVECIYFFQDQDETYEYLEGQAQGVLLLSQAEALRKLPMNVDILLTRARRQEQKEAALQAIPGADAYYDRLAMIPGLEVQARLWHAEKTRPLQVQIMRALDIENADNVFPTMAEIQAAIMQQMAAQQAKREAAMQQQGQPALTDGSPANVVPMDPAQGEPVPQEMPPAV